LPTVLTTGGAYQRAGAKTHLQMKKGSEGQQKERKLGMFKPEKVFRFSPAYIDKEKTLLCLSCKHI